jgi:hypothetical protein
MSPALSSPPLGYERKKISVFTGRDLDVDAIESRLAASGQ